MFAQVYILKRLLIPSYIKKSLKYWNRKYPQNIKAKVK